MNKAKILIVEDEIIVAMDMQNTLNKAGYNVVGIVSKGADAITKARSLKPDIILMDIMLMGNMDGIEAATKITKEHDIPLLFLTANSDEKILERAKLVAPYGYILKPFSMQELIINIDIAIYKHQTKKEISLNQEKYKELYEKLEKEIKQREKLESELNISEERFLKVFQNSPDAINVNALDGTYIEVNQKFIEIIGYSKQEVVGKTSLELGIYANPEDRYEMVEMLLKTGEVKDMEMDFVTRKGDIMTGSMNAAIVEFNNQKCIISVTRDITQQKKIQNELKKQEERYYNQYMFNPMPAFTWQKKGDDFIFTFFNYAANIFTNKKVEEIIGIKASEFFKDYPEVVKDMHIAFNEKTIKNREVLYLFRLSEKTLYIDFTISYSPEDYIIIYANDITDRKEAERNLKNYNLELQKNYYAIEQANEELTSAEEELRQQLDNLTHHKDVIFKERDKLNTIVENIPLYIAQLDTSLNYIFVNKNYADLFGKKVNEIIGNSINDILTKEDFEFVNPFIDKVWQGKLQRFTQYRKTLNKTIDGLYIPNKNQKGDVISYMFIGEDVSKKLEIEKFQKEKEIYEKTNKIKQQFLANMSHEMRTPLCGIIGISELMEKTELDDRQKEFLETIKDSSDGLLMLINNILDISKIEAEKLQIEIYSFSFYKMVFNATNLFRATIDDKNINLILNIDNNIPEFLKSDEYRIKQVINNLVSNAVKFIDKGSITINATKEYQDEYGNIIVKVSVIDSGIGISLENQKLLFQKFSQIDSSNSQRHEGAGLGLSIVKEIVGMLGGDVGVYSKEGEGSHFWFTFKAEVSNYQNIENADTFDNLTTAQATTLNYYRGLL